MNIKARTIRIGLTVLLLLIFQGTGYLARALSFTLEDTAYISRRVREQLHVEKIYQATQNLGWSKEDAEVLIKLSRQQNKPMADVLLDMLGKYSLLLPADILKGITEKVPLPFQIFPLTQWNIIFEIWITQTRDARLSREAEIKALVDMVEEGILTKEEALMRINLEDLEDRLSHMQIDSGVTDEPIATGIGASSGAVGGVIAFDLEDVKKYKNQGLPVILVKRNFIQQLI